MAESGCDGGDDGLDGDLLNMMALPQIESDNTAPDRCLVSEYLI